MELLQAFEFIHNAVLSSIKEAAKYNFCKKNIKHAYQLASAKLY